MFYIKITLIVFWLLSVFVIAALMSLVRFGDKGLNRDVARMISWGVLKIAGIRIESEGHEKLESYQPCIYVSNHQSAMDIVTFGTIFPRNGVVIAKRELLFIPFFGLYFSAAGNILINRKKRVSAVASINRAIGIIKRRKCSIWLFPEGTRNRTEMTLLPFKKGAFYMAISAGVPIIPVISSPLKHLVNPKMKRLRSGTIRAKVLEPISTQGMSADDVDRLLKTTRERMEEAILSLAVAQPSSVN